jgi:hypothetical protein
MDIGGSSLRPIAASGPSPVANGWSSRWCGSSSDRSATVLILPQRGCGAGRSREGRWDGSFYFIRVILTSILSGYNYGINSPRSLRSCPKTLPLSPSKAMSASPRATSLASRSRRRKPRSVATTSRFSSSTRRPASRSRSICATSQRRACRGTQRRGQRFHPPPRRRAVPAVQGSAWSRTRSPCCRVIGTGWRASPAGRRSHCANLWSTPCAPMPARTAFAHRRTPLIASCRRWPAIASASRMPRARSLPAIAATFNRLVQAWPKYIRDHVSRLAAEALRTEHDAA